MFSVVDKILARVVWRGTHTGSYGGVEAAGKLVEVPGSAFWHDKDGKVMEISTSGISSRFLSGLGRCPCGEAHGRRRREEEARRPSDLLEQASVIGGSRSLPCRYVDSVSGASEAVRGRSGVNEPAACAKLGIF